MFYALPVMYFGVMLRQCLEEARGPEQSATGISAAAKSKKHKKDYINHESEKQICSLQQ